MARQKQAAQAAQAAPQAVSLETTVGRVKKDLVWVIISVVVSLTAGLVIGSFFKF